MSCRCKHNAVDIENERKTIWRFKRFFVKRMTVDSKHNDRRRKDFNQAIFHKNSKGRYVASFASTDMDMIMQCFEKAVKDYVQSHCDVDGCTGACNKHNK